MINRFFLETIGEDYDAIHSTVTRLWNRVGPNPLKKVEKMLFRVRLHAERFLLCTVPHD